MTTYADFSNYVRRCVDDCSRSGNQFAFDHIGMNRKVDNVNDFLSILIKACLDRMDGIYCSVNGLIVSDGEIVKLIRKSYWFNVETHDLDGDRAHPLVHPQIIGNLMFANVVIDDGVGKAGIVAFNSVADKRFITTHQFNGCFVPKVFKESFE